MTRGTRFGLWVIVTVAPVAAGLGARVIAAFWHETHAQRWAAWLAGAALLGMTALLGTTPADAIVLTKPASKWIIGLGGCLCGALWASVVAPSVWIGLAAGAVVAVVLGLALALLMPARSMGARRAGSPWWVVPVLWHPVVGVIAGLAIRRELLALTLLVFVAGMAVCVGWLRATRAARADAGRNSAVSVVAAWVFTLSMLAIVTVTTGLIVGSAPAPASAVP